MILIPPVAAVVRFRYRAVIWETNAAREFCAFSLSHQQVDG
jgi:hypothetical protein